MQPRILVTSSLKEVATPYGPPVLVLQCAAFPDGIPNKDLLRRDLHLSVHPEQDNKITYASWPPTTRNARAAGGTKSSSRPMASVLVAWYTCP